MIQLLGVRLNFSVRSLLFLIIQLIHKFIQAFSPFLIWRWYLHKSVFRPSSLMISDFFTGFSMILWFDRLSNFVKHSSFGEKSFKSCSLLQYPRILLVLDDEGLLSVMFNDDDHCKRDGRLRKCYNRCELAQFCLSRG